MFCQANILAFSFVFISALLMVDAQTIVGGYSDVSPDEYKNLQIKLENSNLRAAVGAGNSCVRVVKIVSASQQVVAGMNYKIIAIMDINGKPTKYCLKVYQSLPPVTVTVQCAAKQLGSTICECFKNWWAGN